MRPGHHCLCEFGDTGNGTSCERQFNLGHHQSEDYKHFYNRLNRVEEDSSGLTFQGWTTDVGRWHNTVTCRYVDQLQRVACLWFQAQGSSSSTWDSYSWRTRGVLRSLEGMGPKRFVLSVDDDTEFRSRCEWIIPFFTLKFSIFPIKFQKKKNPRGGVGDTPRMMRMKPLFRPLMDHHDRGISLDRGERGMKMDKNFFFQFFSPPVRYVWWIDRTTARSAHIRSREVSLLVLGTCGDKRTR